MSSSVVIVGAKRTPIGSFNGVFAAVPSPALGATAIRAALESAAVAAADVSEVLMGCVLPAGLGQAPARQAALQSGIPVATGCTTLNKVCGSGMKAVMLAHDLIKAGSADIVVAGGGIEPTHLSAAEGALWLPFWPFRTTRSHGTGRTAKCW
jgi:acetyl-CoA C-acetyltransferase